MEMALFGLGLILLILSWHLAWRPTALDCARDKLFDLRDTQVREYFVSRNLPLDHPIYSALRDLLNGHLRYTDKINFWDFAFSLRRAESHPEIMDAKLREFERRFATDDKELSELVESVRKQAALIMLEYLAESSFFLLAVVLVLVPMYAVKQVYDEFAAHLRRGSVFSAQALKTLLAATFVQVAKMFNVARPESTTAAMERAAFSC